MKIVNKKALHNYHILESLEAGIVLSGSEVKSIRAGRIDLSQAHARILNGEAFLLNANIARFAQSSEQTYDGTKSRKLLIHRSQIDQLVGKTSGKNATLIPISIYEKNNKFKVQIGLAKPKKEFDKRRVVKERDHNRRIQQELRGKE